MDKNEQMRVALEELIISKAQEMKVKHTSPEEIEALTELVKAVNQIPRTMQALD